MKYILILLIAVTLFGCYGVEPEKTGFEGKPIPSFKLLLADSTTYFDTKDIPADKPTVFFYYGPHCPFSRAQMKEIIEDMSKLSGIRFYVFASGAFSEMKKFHSHFNLGKYPNIVSGLDYTTYFENHYKVTGVPFIAIYGKDNKLIKAFEGKIFTKQIKKTLDM